MPQPTTQHSNDGVSNNLRKLIDLIDNCRDADLGQYIQLPRICVVGTQSAGKSSLLEAIVGIDFLPRGEGVVTRRPLEMRLVHTSEDECYAIFDGQCDKVHDFDEVKEIIANKTDEVAGSKKGIVDDPIKVSIYGPEVPDLTLIDLPGITRVPLKNSDQTEDIEAVTKDMVMRYATDPRTVVLAVIPANQDISTSDALQIARNVDPKGIRTLGVITKIDIMDSGTDAVSMLKGSDVHLRLGYIGVKLRSQLDMKTGVTIKSSVTQETQFFSSHAAYRALPATLWGTKTLTAKLAQVLFRHIKHCLPDIRNEISNQQTTATARLVQLGTGPPQDDTERIQLIWSLVTDFCEILKNTIRGKFDRRLSSYFSDSKSLAGGAEIRQIMNELLEDKLKSDMTESMTDFDIDRAIRQHEGDSLPGFPSPDTFEYLLLPHLNEISQPVNDCLERVASTLDVMSHHIISKIFQRFPSLGERVMFLSEKILQEQKSITKNILDKIVAAETGYVFTNDESYLVNHAQMGKMMSNPHPQSIDSGAAARQTQQQSVQQPADPQAARGYSLKGIQAMTSSLLQSTQNGVSNLVGYSGSGPAYSYEFIQEIRSRLNSYFMLVLRNTRETVPKTIGFFLVRSLQDVLQYELYQTLTKSENLDELLGEPEEIKIEREDLKNQKVVLAKANAVLQRDFGNSQGLSFDEYFDRDVAQSINPPKSAASSSLSTIGMKANVSTMNQVLDPNENGFHKQATPESIQPVYGANDGGRLSSMQPSSQTSTSSLAAAPASSAQSDSGFPTATASVKRKGLFG
eukprot:GHVH01006591.1.p1 GENE.GHVH01006591.1~~GHVH01006591.1.p1  ORF type:complete len:798 (-),score=126.07 GHVH01006591.1:104-2497(-)